MSTVWAGGSTRAWRRIRDAVLEENRVKNGGPCRAGCRGVCTTIATVAHPVNGRHVTGDDPRCLVAICAEGNVHIGDPMQHPGDCSKCAHITWAPRNRDPKPTPLTKW